MDVFKDDKSIVAGAALKELQWQQKEDARLQDEINKTNSGFQQAIDIVGQGMKDNEGESDDDRAKREKNEKTKRIINTLSDGLSALANLGGAVHGSTVQVYDPMKGSALGVVNASIEKARADREARKERYNAFAMKHADLQNQRDAAIQALQDRSDARKRQHEADRRQEQLDRWAVIDRERQDDAYEYGLSQRMIKEQQDKEEHEAKIDRLNAEANWYNSRDRGGGIKTTTRYDNQGIMTGYSTTGPGRINQHAVRVEEEPEGETKEDKAYSSVPKKSGGKNKNKLGL